jgi:hypothetical protein
MKNISIRLTYFSVFFLSFGFCRCDDRRDIIDLGADMSKTLLVRITIDWSRAGIDPKNASIWLFNADDGSLALSGRPELTNETELTIHLPRGQYSILVFNGTTNDHDSIRFRGTDGYQTFEAYAYNETPPSENAAAYMRANEDRTCIAPPDLLAAAHLDRLEITSRMIEQKETVAITFTPLRLVSQIHVTVHFRDLLYSATSGHSGMITGMAGSVFLVSGKTGDKEVCQAFTLNNRVFYSGSSTDGTMSRMLSCFGLPKMTYYPLSTGETSHALWLNVRLRNGEYMDFNFNVTGGLTIVEGDDATIGLNLSVVKGDGNTLFPPEIRDPVTLPEVPETDLPGGGFDPDVDGWGENTDVPIPID